MLILPQEALLSMRRHALDTYPEECCGILLGRAGEPGAGDLERERRVARALPARNLNRERAADRYLLDPADQFRAERQARIEGLEVLGFYHSHPDHPCLPSATDLQLSWEGYSYLILAVREGSGVEERCWRRAPGNPARFSEEALRTP